MERRPVGTVDHGFAAWIEFDWLGDELEHMERGRKRTLYTLVLFPVCW